MPADNHTMNPVASINTKSNRKTCVRIAALFTLCKGEDCLLLLKNVEIRTSSRKMLLCRETSKPKKDIPDLLSDYIPKV
jgi:hypothetical protein